MPLERNLYNLAIRQIKDQVTAPADLDGLYQLVPLLISVDGGWITALLQHLLKGRFDFLIPESGRLAGLVAVVLVVTVPNIVMLACTAQPPNLMTVERAAVATDEFSGKRMFGAHFRPALGGCRQHRLHPVKHFRLYDWFMGVAHTDGWYLAVVFPDFFSEIVYGKGFLEKCLTFVFFVTENTADSADAPFGSACWRQDAHIRQDCF